MKYRNTIAITVICLIIGLAVAWQYKSVYNNKNRKCSKCDFRRLKG